MQTLIALYAWYSTRRPEVKDVIQGIATITFCIVVFFFACFLSTKR